MKSGNAWTSAARCCAEERGHGVVKRHRSRDACERPDLRNTGAFKNGDGRSANDLRRE